ncbi:MAG: hypothetical protein Q8J74_03540 [Candidatus Didemnitutus sp.]|nr:hypothetical protein [Candidatus Didemnitutus sp.]
MVVLRWKPITGVLIALLTLAWIASSVALWGYLRSIKGVRQAVWVDIVLPFRWENLRQSIGEHHLEEASSAVALLEFDRALHLYRVGVARSPRNTGGRLGLARLYVVYRRPDLAHRVISDNLINLSQDLDYLKASLQFLLEFQYDAELALACEQLLARPRFVHRQLVGFYAATIAYFRGNLDRAQSLVLVHRLEQTPEGALLQARIDVERGYAELALLRLDDLVQRGTASEEAFNLIGQIRRDLGQTRQIVLNATLRLSTNPLSHAPRVDFLYLYHQLRDSEALERGIQSYLDQFGQDQGALLALGDFAANTGRPELVNRIARVFHQNDWPVEAPALMAAEATIVAGRYAEGLDLIRAYTTANPKGAERFAAVFDSLQAVAHTGLNRPDDARLYLEHLLIQPNLRAENLHTLATRLITLGHPNHARTLLSRAVALDRLNQSALTSLVRLEAHYHHFDTLPGHVRQLMAMRQPSRTVLEFAYREFGRDFNLLHPEQKPLLAELRTHLSRATTKGPP